MSEPMPEVAAAAVPHDGWLLDVREPYEWAAGHSPAAWHIPMGQLGPRSGEIPRDEVVYVICRSGNRSAYVTRALNGAGWQAVNVAGGMKQWAAARRPMVSEGGSAPVVA
jgi:rhodanese-related sulfurtransferase